MKALLLIILCLSFAQKVQSQILFASSRKSISSNIPTIKKGLLALDGKTEQNFYSEKDSVDFKLDTPKIINLINRDSIYTKVEEEAYFKGGKEEMYNHIYKNLSKNHKRKGTKVVLKLTIENFGGISHPHVLSCGNDEKLANDILKIVQTMKIWTPAKIFGFDVNSYYQLVVVY
jgi:hypothetical protein